MIIKHDSTRKIIFCIDFIFFNLTSTKLAVFSIVLQFCPGVLIQSNFLFILFEKSTSIKLSLFYWSRTLFLVLFVEIIVPFPESVYTSSDTIWSNVFQKPFTTLLEHPCSELSRNWYHIPHKLENVINADETNITIWRYYKVMIDARQRKKPRKVPRKNLICSFSVRATGHNSDKIQNSIVKLMVNFILQSQHRIIKNSNLRRTAIFGWSSKDSSTKWNKTLSRNQYHNLVAPTFLCLIPLETFWNVQISLFLLQKIRV